MCMSTEDKKASWVGWVCIQPSTIRSLERTVSKTCCEKGLSHAWDAAPGSAIQ
jgi:hypothetical protein